MPIGGGGGITAPLTPASTALRARLGGARVVTVSVPGLLLEEWEPEELEVCVSGREREKCAPPPHTRQSTHNFLPQLFSLSSSFQSGATLRLGVASALRSLSSAVPGGVYLVARVSGDIGEAAVRAALEAGGVVGGGRGGSAAPPPAAASTSTSTAAASTAAPPAASPRRPHPPIPPQRLLFCETVTGKVALARQLEAGLHIDGCGATVRRHKKNGWDGMGMG